MFPPQRRVPWHLFPARPAQSGGGQNPCRAGKTSTWVSQNFHKGKGKVHSKVLFIYSELLFIKTKLLFLYSKLLFLLLWRFSPTDVRLFPDPYGSFGLPTCRFPPAACRASAAPQKCCAVGRSRNTLLSLRCRSGLCPCGASPRGNPVRTRNSACCCVSRPPARNPPPSSEPLAACREGRRRGDKSEDLLRRFMDLRLRDTGGNRVAPCDGAHPCSHTRACGAQLVEMQRQWT